MKLQGTLRIPGDKSISHRAIMLGALAEGKTEIRHFLPSADCLATISCFRAMGIPISISDTSVIVEGKGLYGLTAPEKTLDCANSGTTMRLLAGLLAGQSFSATLTGDSSLQRRPMQRIALPLRQMGAVIHSVMENDDPEALFAPFQLSPAALHGICYRLPVASAQVKSCLLLAGLYADTPTTVVEPAPTRDHTERMLAAFGAEIYPESSAISVQPHPHLEGMQWDIPGDLSSAAYFLTAASCLPDSDIILQQVGINPTRDGILRVLQAMGAEIEVENVRLGREPSADLRIRGANLHGTEIAGGLIPSLIDEIPVLAVAATMAEGETIIRDAEELKVKESNRLELVVNGLSAMGADIEQTADGMRIRGGKKLHGAPIDVAGDHRLAMSFAIASLFADGENSLSDTSCVSISYPDFFRDLSTLII